MTAGLVAFLRAMLYADEIIALDAKHGWPPGDEIAGLPASIEVGAHLHRHGPDRTLREIEAKRSIIASHHGSGVTCRRCSLGSEAGEVVFELDPCETLRLLALPYVDHDDYRVEWAPRYSDG